MQAGNPEVVSSEIGKIRESTVSAYPEDNNALRENASAARPCNPHRDSSRCPIVGTQENFHVRGFVLTWIANLHRGKSIETNLDAADSECPRHD